MRRLEFTKGDTIIEVLLAVTVFSLVAVGSMTIMNRSSNLAQQAVEITLVRQQIDAQAEALRAAHQAYSRMAAADRDSSGWSQLKDFSSVNSIGTSSCPKKDELSAQGAFIMNPTSGGIISVDGGGVRSILKEDDNPVPIYAQVVKDEGAVIGYGLWIEARKIPAQNPSVVPDAYNFRIRACWNSIGTGRAPMQLETTVRLYDVET